MHLMTVGRWEELAPTVRHCAAPDELVAWAQSVALACFGQQRAAFLLETAGRPVGYAVAHVLPAGLAGTLQGYLGHVYVEPVWRRRGGGTALMQTCEDWLRARGCADVTATVPLHQPEALVMAERRGYAPERCITALPLAKT